MAKREKSQQPAPNGEQELSEIALTGEELSPALEKLYAEMGIEGAEGQANVYISKLLTDGREAKIWQGTPADYDLMSIARKYGSGDYRVKLYIQSESGRFVMKGNQVFPVLLEAGEDARLVAMREGKGPEVPGAATSAQSAMSNADIAKMIAEAVRAAIPVQQPPNTLGMMKEVAEIVRTLAPQQAVPIAQPQINPVELLRAFAEVSRLREDADPIDRGTNATANDIFLRLIDKFAPLFAQTIQAQQPAAGATPALPAPENPQPKPPQQQPVAAAAAVNKEAEEATMKLKMGLAFLVMQAEAGNDAETYADVVLDNVAEDDLEKFLQNPQPLAYLVQFEPRVNQHAAWFTKLIETVKEELAGTDSAVDPSKKAG